MGDCWFCHACYTAWKAEFDACEHDWEPELSEFGEDGLELFLEKKAINLPAGYAPTV